jgi:hypothetical protein
MPCRKKAEQNAVYGWIIAGFAFIIIAYERKLQSGTAAASEKQQYPFKEDQQ